MERGHFYLGCAIWAYAGWNGSFYPKGAKDHLALYAERLSAVEGNTTFYSIPSPEIVERWASKTPESFRFLPKLPRDVTHNERLAPFAGAALDFIERMRGLGPRFGPILAQLPPDCPPERFDDLCSFLDQLQSARHPICVEVRHPDWFEEPHRRQLFEALATRKIGRAILDSRPVYEKFIPSRKPELPVRPEATSRACMIRFVGHPERERNRRYLDDWARKASSWIDQGRDVYFFAHCPLELQSPFIARDFHERLIAHGVELPALEWEAEPVQEELF